MHIIPMSQDGLELGPKHGIISHYLISSVYKAAGLGAYELYDDVDFDTWYSTQLLNELQLQDPRYASVCLGIV